MSPQDGLRGVVRSRDVTTVSPCLVSTAHLPCGSPLACVAPHRRVQYPYPGSCWLRHGMHGEGRGQVARDRFHGAARRALEKGGWTVTADPYLVRFDRTTVEIDLAAELLT